MIEYLHCNDLPHGLLIGNVTRLCNSRGIWTPSPIDTFNRCASNKLGKPFFEL